MNLLIISFNPFDHEYDGGCRYGDVYDYDDDDDDVQDGGFLCPSEIKYAKPKRGKTAQVNHHHRHHHCHHHHHHHQGTWKDIVNVADYTQTLRMEKCL